jgi:preprotein translocase subunit SecA
MRESIIIQDAGRKGAVTVATNMAGRGVDIILGGQPPSEFETQYSSPEGQKRFKKEKDEWQKNHDEVVENGGLFVIGTEKHESRRIDNQLRGRSGRQGDPGKSVFIISLEDDLMRIFGGEQISNLMTRFNFPEDQPLTHSLVTRVITQAQVKVEGFNFESRKYTVEYDDVLNKQREIIYGMRRELLENEGDHDEFITTRLNTAIDAIIDMQYVVEAENIDDSIISAFINREEKKEFLRNLALDIFKRRKEEVTPELMNQLIKAVSLQVIDNLWMDHLTAMEDLRIGIRLQAFSQKDPLIEYKNAAFSQFEKLVDAIDDGIINRIFKVQIVTERPTVDVSAVSTNTPVEEVGIDAISNKSSLRAKRSNLKSSNGKETVSENKKLGRNDPCWCGSGKKYKRCHYPVISA